MKALDPTAKSIGDLDSLLQLLCKSVRRSKPWERTLHEQLTQADRHVLRARVCLSMGGNSAELMDAVHGICESLRVADLRLSKGRCDGTTRAAVKLAHGLAQGLQRTLHSTVE